MAVVILAEKPSVARDIAAVVGATERARGYLHGNGHRVTWAVGHLVALPEPDQINSDWKTWRQDRLPMLPDRWPLRVVERTREQFDVVARLINDSKTSQIICATDAGREGELIFRYIYEAAGCKKSFRRLWISSLTPEAIRDGLAHLKDGTEFDHLAAAARGRSRADWLVGMNLSRAYALAYDDRFSVGRVQTPTLAMLVQRDQIIDAFVPEKYLEVHATFRSDGDYCGTYVGADSKPRRLRVDGEEAERIVARAKAGVAEIRSVQRDTRRLRPPTLYDLTELQRHANRLFGYSADKTLGLAQALYERHKLISYPRTDSRHLTAAIAKTLPDVIQAIATPYEKNLAPGTGERALGKRFVDDARVTDHHAIIPTTTGSTGMRLSREESKIYELICRRLLTAWHDDHLRAVTTVFTAISSLEAGDVRADIYRSVGTSVEQIGWRVLDFKQDRAADPTAMPAGLARGQRPEVRDAKAVAKTTQPPPRLTDATLLTAMESAGKTLDDKELCAAMAERGLGTPATRASIIETLLARQYVERRGKALVSTAKGKRLIEVVHPDVKSPAMTGDWERELRAIGRGEGDFEAFMHGIAEYVTCAVTSAQRSGPQRDAPSMEESKSTAASLRIRAAKPADNGGRATPPGSDNDQSQPVRRAATSDLIGLLRSTFAFDSFRPHQETICKSISTGDHALVVMPTGAGKSLCYQLPGLARGGTTLVISPLIALIEDQVAKLQAIGLRAERIHSGRERTESRQVCFDYLDGHLDFLFVAPERLGVPRFPEMLAKRKPVLVAVDEAHCISQWGHDFRPDYRKLKERLQLLAPAPMVALTATATRRVQDDIVEQLGMASAKRFIHGFRRDNIAIEAAEIAVPQRTATILRILGDSSCRPCIVYAPTRKLAESIAGALGHELTAAAYHAGMTAVARDEIQSRFLAGDLEVIVATIAFGMGIDKHDIRTIIHAALPGTVEGYYQEIGRAGRDGKPSRAILMYSYADRRTHEWFQERDYPDPERLEQIFARLSEDPLTCDALRHDLGLAEDDFDRLLGKLRIHSGAHVDSEQNVRRGKKGWRKTYAEQRQHKIQQLEQIVDYAQGGGCRMVRLVDYFGDREDSREPCGTCDFCASATTIAQVHRPPSAGELSQLTRILAALVERDHLAVGTIYRDHFEGNAPRREVEALLDALARGGLVAVYGDSFEKEGREIKFRRVTLLPKGRDAAKDAGMLTHSVRVPESVGTAGAGRGRRRKKSAADKRTKKPAKKLESTTSANSEAEIEAPAAVVETLKAWRLDQARSQGIPAYCIFPNRVLVQIAAVQPRSSGELLQIKGVGPKLLEKYGDEVLALLRL